MACLQTHDFSEVHHMSFAAYAWLLNYFYKNSCVGLSLKRVSFFQRDRSFATFFSFYQHHHIELLDRILISISSYAFYLKSSFTTVVKAKVMAKNKVLNPLIQIALP